MKKTYKWTVEIEVDPIWVADGFDLDKERLIDMIASELAWAHGHEFNGKVLRAPDPKQIRTEQGYKDHANEGYKPYYSEE